MGNFVIELEASNNYNLNKILQDFVCLPYDF